MRLIITSSLACLLCVSACASSDPYPNGNNGTAGASAAGAGAPAAVAGSAATAAGASAGGAAPAAAGSPSIPSGAAGKTGSGGAGSGDNGDLFDSTNTVPFTGDTANGGVGGGPPTGDGNSAMTKLGSLNGTIVLQQTGTDVTVTVNVTNCPDGNHGISIRAGFSCDSDALEKGVWDGLRGELGDKAGTTISCSNKKGSLTYTRKGADPKTNWTVATGDFATDPTTHVIVVTSSADPTSSHLVCSDFR